MTSSCSQPRKAAVRPLALALVCSMARILIGTGAIHPQYPGFSQLQTYQLLGSGSRIEFPTPGNCIVEEA